MCVMVVVLCGGAGQRGGGEGGEEQRGRGKDGDKDALALERQPF